MYLLLHSLDVIFLMIYLTTNPVPKVIFRILNIFFSFNSSVPFHMYFAKLSSATHNFPECQIIVYSSVLGVSRYLNVKNSVKNYCSKFNIAISFSKYKNLSSSVIHIVSSLTTYCVS